VEVRLALVHQTPPVVIGTLTFRLLFVRLAITNRVLYGEVWPDSALSQRDRSLVTVSALIALNRPEQLRTHIARAKQNGVTREEMAALITHLAFYAGWSSAVSAVSLANEVFQNR